MCDHAPNREAAMVTIRRDEDGTPTVWCDPCIAPLVDALNTAGMPTVASCCGHGEYPTRVALADGREIVIAARTSTATADDAQARLRDLTRRLGFGDDIGSLMADNDTIIKFLEEQARDADEWRESQRWRDDCYAKGHPDDEDCWECDPSLRLIRAEEAATADTGLRERVEALRDPGVLRLPYLEGENAATVRGWVSALDEVLDLLDATAAPTIDTGARDE